MMTHITHHAVDCSLEAWSVLGQAGAVPGQTWSVLGQAGAVPGQAGAVLGQAGAVLGQAGAGQSLAEPRTCSEVCAEKRQLVLGDL